MATKKGRKKPSAKVASGAASSSVEELLLAALERGDDSFETGRTASRLHRGGPGSSE